MGGGGGGGGGKGGARKRDGSTDSGRPIEHDSLRHIHTFPRWIKMLDEETKKEKKRKKE